MKLSGPIADTVVDNFRRSLRDGSGCSYAAALAYQRRVAFEVHDEPPNGGEVDDSLDAYAAANFVAVLLLPFVASERVLVDVLTGLRSSSPRWRLRKGSHTTQAVHVAVEWTTSENLIDDTMGFAPLLTMPVPRRSPYVAIALWPGGQQNPLRGVPPTPAARAGRVSFLDVPHGFDEETNARMWKTTEEKVAELMTLPADRPSLYRRAAFVLSPAAVEGLAFDL